MSLHNKRLTAILSAFLLILSILLTSCGYERIGLNSKLGETGEFYTASGETGRSGDSGQSENLGLSGRSGQPENSGLFGHSGQSENSEQSGHAPNEVSSSTNLQQEFEFFCQTIFKEEMLDSNTLDLHYTLLHPENYGIEPGEVTLGTYKIEEMLHDNKEIKDLKSRLAAFDRESLTQDQKLTYDTLMETLNTSLMAEGLELYEQPLAPTIGVQAQLPILLAEYSFQSIKDVEDYIALLSQIDRYYSEILEFENQKASAGLGSSDATIDSIIESCQSYLIDPNQNFLTETFDTRLASLEKNITLTSEQKSDFIARHNTAICEHFIPAYQSLIDGMTALKGRGLNDGGLSGFKNGQKYYEYLIKSGPGSSYTVLELKSALVARMQEDFEAMAQLFTAYPNLENLLQTSKFTLTDPNAILEDLKSKMAADFPVLADCDYEIRYVPTYLEDSLSPAFYLTAPLDDTNHNVIYINNSYADSVDSLYTTLAHEGFPGHLYQTVYNRTNASSPLFSILSCSGANEGWATYVENYAYTLDNGLPAGVGEYNALLRSYSLCVHGILDIGINYEGWTKEEAKEFVSACFQVDDKTVETLWQLMIDNPTNYLDYCGGYVEILEMRREAETALGGKFVLKDFHQFILDIGPVPFTVMRSYFAEWVAARGGCKNSCVYGK